MRIRILPLLGLVMLATAFQSNAEATQSVAPCRKAINSDGSTLRIDNSDRFEILHSSGNLPKKPYEGPNKVTVNVLYPEKYMVGNCYLFDGEQFLTLFLDEDVNVSTGSKGVDTNTYDIIVACDKMSEIMGVDHTVFVIKENVYIDKDCEITLDPDDANILYDFTSVKSDGQTVVLPQYIVHDNPDNPFQMDMELVREGTVADLTLKTILCKKNAGPLVATMSTGNSEIEQFNQNPIREMNALISPSEEYFVIQLRTYQNGDKANEVVALIPDDIHQYDVTNQISDFNECNIPLFDRIQASLDMEHQPKSGAFPVLTLFIDDANTSASSWSHPALLVAGKDQVDCNMIRTSYPPKKNLIRSIETSLKPRFTDMTVRYQVDTIWWDDKNYQIRDMTINSYDFGRTINFSRDETPDVSGQLLTSFLSLDTDLANKAVMPSHPYFPTFENMANQVYNATQPYVTNVFSSSSDGIFYDFTFLDNIGGNISTYIFASDYTVKYENEEIFDSSFEFDNYYDRYQEFMNILAQPRVPGKLEWDMVTLSGNIGGVESYTRFNSKFGQSSSDGTAPTLQILSFVDADGNFTTSFKSPDEGRILLVGGDIELSSHGINGTQCFAPLRGLVTPVVEYSICGMESWEDLTLKATSVEADACYGDSWEINMKQIEAPLDKTLYDLRVSLTDRSGNSMTQVISPAFMIDKNSGSLSLDMDKRGVYIDGNSIRGPKEMRVFSADGRPCDCNNLPHGLYIVKTACETVKIIL